MTRSILVVCCILRLTTFTSQVEDSEAEKIFSVMRDKITSAKALTIAVSGGISKDKLSTQVWVVAGNLVRHEIETTFPSGKKTDVLWLSDGTTSIVRSPYVNRAVDTDEKLTVKYLELLANHGCLSALSAFWTGRTPAPEFVNTNFKLGNKEKIGDRDAHVIHFVENWKDKGHAPKSVTIWIDAETYLPLKRMLVYAPGLSEEENYRTFELNPHIDPKVFELPK
jgi:outer membrane lipoprotein-sorting protein